MKTIFTVLILSAVASCGPAQQIKHRAPLFENKDKLVVVSDKADKDIIAEKYHHEIDLNCSFIIDNRADTNITGFTPAGFTKNLARGEVPTHLLFTMNNGQKFTAGVRVKKFDILPEVKLNLPDGSVRVLRATPVVELIVRGRDILRKKDKRYERSMTLYENSSVVFTDLFPKKYPHLFKCELQTKPDERYKDDDITVANFPPPPITE
jgi:hypothetical protein